MKFVLASNNKKKLCEMGDILLSLGHEIVSMEQAGISSEPEETGDTFEKNALIKARAACIEAKMPALADDSGLEVDALGGAPGVLSARYCEGSDDDRVDLLLKNMENVPQAKRTARFVSAIACVLPNGEEMVVRGVCAGEILKERTGGGGFGYDPVFYVRSQEHTFASMPQEIKNKISHRANAMALMCDKLKGIILC